MSQKLIITKEASRLISWKVADFSPKKSNSTIDKVVQSIKEEGEKAGFHVASVTYKAQFQPDRISRVDLQSGNGALDGYVAYKPPNRQYGKNAQIMIELNVDVSIYNRLYTKIRETI